MPGLYIHIPFCKGKCNYCHFYSLCDINLIPAYIDALHDEIAIYTRSYNIYDSIYFGGGTPSLLDIHHFTSILDAIKKHFQLSPNLEITVEVNPADQSLAWYKELRALGVNRLNIGIQSFDDHVLRFLGRRHTAADSYSAIEMACVAGFNNIGLDLMYGIPGQNLTAWQETLDRAVKFAPAHLSCYELSVEEGTPLAVRYGNKAFSLPDNEQQWDFFRTTSEYLEGAGYSHYEVSNFSRQDSMASRHNRKYWNHTPYLGLGPAAHSFSENRRWWNHTSLNAYIMDLSAGRAPVSASEHLTNDQLRLETIFLGLRTRTGIDLNLYRTEYCEDLLTANQGILEKLIHEDFFVIRDDRLIPTLKGMAMADRLAVILSDGSLQVL